MLGKRKEVLVDYDKLNELYNKFESNKKKLEDMTSKYEVNLSELKQRVNNEAMLEFELNRLNDAIESLNVKLYRQENIEIASLKKRVAELEDALDIKDCLLSSKQNKITELTLTKPHYEKVDIHV